VDADIAALRPSEPFKPCANAATRAGKSGSSAAKYVSTPIRRIRSGCCARAASGHAAAPPRAVKSHGVCATMSYELRWVAPWQAEIAGQDE
jgi:hypothetical protein